VESQPHSKQNLGLTYTISEVGEGIKVAAVKDPFGNRFDIIENSIFDLKAVR
jgi:hypothetical protein